MNQAIFRRICTELLVRNCGNISPTICTNMLIFSKDTYLVLMAWMISRDTLSSQILIFVISPFATLFIQKESLQNFWQGAWVWDRTILSNPHNNT